MIQVSMGYYIRSVHLVMRERSLNELHSVNGCSMKTAEQLEMIKKIPLDKLLLETGMPDEMNLNISLTCFHSRCALVFINWRSCFETPTRITTNAST